MTHRPVRTIAPAVTPVSLTEAADYLRVEVGGPDDSLITRLIRTAAANLDGASGLLGRCLVTQTWVQRFDAWAQVLRLPFPDVQSATVTYVDAEDAELTVATGLYALLEDARGAYLRFEDEFTSPVVGPETAGIAVTLVAGYGTATAVPEDLRQAILLHVGTLYEFRESLGEKVASLGTYEALVRKYRRVGV